VAELAPDGRRHDEVESDIHTAASSTRSRQPMPSALFRVEPVARRRFHRDGRNQPSETNTSGFGIDMFVST
jgi:hypothetical protein